MAERRLDYILSQVVRWSRPRFLHAGVRSGQGVFVGLWCSVPRAFVDGLRRRNPPSVSTPDVPGCDRVSVLVIVQGKFQSRVGQAHLALQGLQLAQLVLYEDGLKPARVPAGQPSGPWGSPIPRLTGTGTAALISGFRILGAEPGQSFLRRRVFPWCAVPNGASAAAAGTEHSCSVCAELGGITEPPCTSSASRGKRPQAQQPAGRDTPM